MGWRLAFVFLCTSWLDGLGMGIDSFHSCSHTSRLVSVVDALNTLSEPKPVYFVPAVFVHAHGITPRNQPLSAH